MFKVRLELPDGELVHEGKILPFMPFKYGNGEVMSPWPRVVGWGERFFLFDHVTGVLKDESDGVGVYREVFLAWVLPDVEPSSSAR